MINNIGYITEPGFALLHYFLGEKFWLPVLIQIYHAREREKTSKISSTLAILTLIDTALKEPKISLANTRKVA